MKTQDLILPFVNSILISTLLWIKEITNIEYLDEQCNNRDPD